MPRILCIVWSALTLLAYISTAKASSSFPNPISNPSACHSDNATARICDPDGILTYEERREVQEEITQYEALNITCKDEVVHIQLGVALTRTVGALLCASSSLELECRVMFFLTIFFAC